MAGTDVWGEAMSRITKIDSKKKNTIETYSSIRDKGLYTVFWENYKYEKLLDSIEKIRDFINKNKPCLFIYNPTVPGVSKDFLFGVTDISEVKEWIRDNSENLDKYYYLITSQITNPGDGFVGSVYSDGKGKIFCETLHQEGICNHRILSHGKCDSTEVSSFYVENFELLSREGKFLAFENIKDIFSVYWDKKGYFEFVNGIQSGRRGIYTTGFEELRGMFDFPEEICESQNFNLHGRLAAILYREIGK